MNLTAWKQQILTEYQTIQQDEDALINQEMNKRIIQTWTQQNPALHQQLKTLGIVTQAATVMQARMWKERDDLIAEGMPVTDAREIAERNHLMQQPEIAEPTE